jgi:hypothetical protein
MSDPFHKRFNIEVKLEEAQQRFLERVRTATQMALAELNRTVQLNNLLELVCFKMGTRPHFTMDLTGSSSFMELWDDVVSGDFTECLRMTEAVHDATLEIKKTSTAKELSSGIVTALRMSEVDLEIEWNGRIFTRKGAKLLDDRLINDPLHWLGDAKYENVLKPFEKGLKHWMEANKDRERYGDVITDMFEALEALAKVVTGRDNDFSGNREKFASELRLPEQYKRMLKEYDSFANEYRHAARPEKPRKYPSERDTEAFMYMTGLFIRRAIQPN